MPLERELKYSLLDPPPPADEIASAFRGSPFALGEGVTRAHRDRYYDDAHGTLGRAGFALRRRHDGATEVAALKAQGTITGAAHERDELEGRVVDGAWPAVILARLAPHLGEAGAARLRVRIEIDTLRTSFEVRTGEGRVATLCFDDVEARYPGSDRSALFREAEIEAAGDTPIETLHAIAQRLERLVTLTPSSVTKLQRAEAVLMLGAGL